VTDPQAFAELLCGYCLDVAAGEQVLLRSTTLAAPLLLELQRAVLARRAWPLLRVELPGESEVFYAHAADEQLDSFAPLALVEAERLDCRIAVQAPFNTRALGDVDPGRLARAARSRRPVRDALLAGTRWCGTLWPTEALAQQAGMSLAGYAAFVRGALFLDRDDPVAAWGELREFQARLIERLASARELHIEAPGTDLRLRVDGRSWINSDGRRNMPSGEVFTGPVEDSAEGSVSFDLPSSPAGVQVSGVRLTLRAGEVVAAEADQGAHYLREMLASDAGARRLGELGIGTNYGIDRPTGTILLDEKIGGSVHLALGRSYPETGGRNESALHWDLICDLRAGGMLSADGEPIQRDGRFLV
jgi:aminopeptidase